MKKTIIYLYLFLVILMTSRALYAAELQVTIKGMNDGKKTTRQRDYKNAVLDAKIKAIEQAGVEIKSLTEVKNFQVKEDLVETKSEGILLPGYQIIDIGYIADGTYQVVLVGKIRTKVNIVSDTGWLVYHVGNKARLLCYCQNNFIGKEFNFYIDGVKIAPIDNSPQIKVYIIKLPVGKHTMKVDNAFLQQKNLDCGWGLGGRSARYNVEEFNFYDAYSKKNDKNTETMYTSGLEFWIEKDGFTDFAIYNLLSSQSPSISGSPKYCRMTGAEVIDYTKSGEKTYRELIKQQKDHLYNDGGEVAIIELDLSI